MNEPIINFQPSVALQHQIVTQGIFPTRGGSESGSVSLSMAFIRTTATAVAPDTTATGQLLPIAQNTAIFSLLGTTYGGNGQTNFALPELDARVIVGAGTGPGLPSRFLGQSSSLDSFVVTPSMLPPSAGGTSAPVGNEQPALALNWVINPGGSFGGDYPTFPGAVHAFAGNFVPDGMMAADGRTLAIADHPALFFAIGDAYGGDGVTTFAVPDLRGRAVVGADAQTPRGSQVGTPSFQITDQNLPTAVGGGGQPIDNRGPAVAMNYLIALQGVFPSFDRPFPEETVLGEVVAFAGTNPPSGWAFANGQLLPINQYQAMFALLGTNFGGDGRVNFALPDLRGNLAIGRDLGDGVPALGGRLGTNSVTLAVQNLPDIADVGAPTDADPAENRVFVNAAVGTTVGLTAQAVDTDAFISGVSYSLVAPTGEFAIDAQTGVVTVAGPIDPNGGPSRSIEVRATSQDGSTASRTFSIAIDFLDDFDVTEPVDTNVAENRVAENAAVGTLVGVTAAATDADATANGVSYALVGPTGEFAIDAQTGVVTVEGPIDREAGASRTIEVRATSQDGSSATRTFTIAVDDVDEFDVTPPQDTNPAPDRVAENSPIGTLVGVTAQSADADATTSGVVYELVDPTGEFAIDPSSGVVSVAGPIDFELGPSRTITVRATSQDGSEATAEVVIAIEDSDEPPPTVPVNGGAVNDIVFHNTATGALVYLDMAPAGPLGFQPLLGALPAGWSVPAARDIFADGSAEIVIVDPTGPAYGFVPAASWGLLGTVPDGWTVQDVADFTGDGSLDLALTRASDAANAYLDLEPGGGQSFGALPGPGATWRVVGYGDLDRDGVSDVVLQNTVGGEILYADIDAGGVHAGWGFVAGGLGSTWVGAGVGDLNGDGFDDVVIRNVIDHRIYAADMAGGANSGFILVTPGVTADWEVASVLDHDGDGFDEVLARRQSDGTVYAADMLAGVFVGWDVLTGQMGTDWVLV